MTRRRSRRALLRAGALAATGLAGCVGELDDWPDGTETERRRSDETIGSPETRSTTPEPTTEAPAVELEPVAVRSSFFYLDGPQTVGVEAEEGTQFAFVRVRPRTDSPRPSDVALVADDRHFWGTVAPGDVGGPRRLTGLGSVYRAGEDRPGWVAFEVPNPLDAEEVALTYDGRDRSLGDAAVSALRAPPADFELAAFDAPDRVAPGASFDVSAEVENVGEGDGVFRASLNELGPVYGPNRASVAVPADESRERTWTVDASDSPDAERVRLELDSVAGVRKATVAVVGDTGPGTTADGDDSDVVRPQVRGG
ncbi:hypothetical protein [Halorussus sp. AFM4]|uniref:hypothetical protein n=1 Tax=Halorussus sp. AFM4 TaxID=3421651 RepID=UPI003EBCF803